MYPLMMRASSPGWVMSGLDRLASANGGLVRLLLACVLLRNPPLVSGVGTVTTGAPAEDTNVLVVFDPYAISIQPATRPRTAARSWGCPYRAVCSSGFRAPYSFPHTKRPVRLQGCCCTCSGSS